MSNVGDFMQLARARWSVRSFSSRPIEEEKLHQILEAGLIAPTAVNYRPQKIYVLQSDYALRKIRAITRSTYSAPTVLLVCYDNRLSWESPFVEGYDCGEMDATIIWLPCTHAKTYAPWHNTFRLNQNLNYCFARIFLLTKILLFNYFFV